ncbi:hypothetical protein CHLRE_02g088151v5 [Chlamydomonas reinhardtii]|uniref:Uncharacterized protein n=1 Tax=Chlamydomonas reinhardtii TaxID=3055 RepID=A0A2K3E130_CHLRE|nr:uncharacterized protein CHLRE_02g088151v5 [Chlamydomonas reinhardtii]PNW86479.1 hypothetical protein CHLRE_02g088151v5 [Chlamydomonas reinhardtii]
MPFCDVPPLPCLFVALVCGTARGAGRSIVRIAQGQPPTPLCFRWPLEEHGTSWTLSQGAVYLSAADVTGG